MGKQAEQQQKQPSKYVKQPRKQVKQQQKQPRKQVMQQQKQPMKLVKQQQKQPRKQRNNAIREVQKGDERAERPRKDNKRKETGGEVRDKWMRLQPGRERQGKRQNKQNEVKRTQKYVFRQKDKKREEAKQKESIDREK